MSVKYKLVLKKDLTQGAAADAKRYYASAPVSGMMDFDSICELIADRSTASDGDVALVVLGLIRAMEEALLRNEVVQLGRLGNFRLSIGSSGTVEEKDFQANMIRKPKIIFTPGDKLRAMIEKVSRKRRKKAEATARKLSNLQFLIFNLQFSIKKYDSTTNQLRQELPAGRRVCGSLFQHESHRDTGTGCLRKRMGNEQTGNRQQQLFRSDGLRLQ